MVSVVDLGESLLICFRQTQTYPLKAEVFLFTETWGWGREGGGYKSYLSSLICLQSAESFKFSIQKPPDIKMSTELIKYLSTDNCWSVWISEAWIKGIEGQEREDHISNCSVQTQPLHRDCCHRSKKRPQTPIHTVVFSERWQERKIFVFTSALLASLVLPLFTVTYTEVKDRKEQNNLSKKSGRVAILFLK